MTKNHATNPRWMRMRRDGEAKMQRRLRRLSLVRTQVEAQAVYDAIYDRLVGRCQVRDRFGHRCSLWGTHEYHRAFGREFVEAGG